MFKKLPIQHLPIQSEHDEMERNAYNAAFCELGFRWYWDCDTYEQLRGQGTNGAERIRHYLETHQPHLLKAYDAAFLVGVIEGKMAEYRKHRADSGTPSQGHFDWTKTLERELGA